jgi:D-alanyl-D-alanine carboxypeptidase
MKKKQPQDQPRWLAPALDYTQDWLSFQVERYRQPGCAVAIAQGNELVAEYAFGDADLRTKQRMTPRHRFRIASHSKSFTASGVLLLREQGKLGLTTRSVATCRACTRTWPARASPNCSRTARE